MGVKDTIFKVGDLCDFFGRSYAQIETEVNGALKRKRRTAPTWSFKENSPAQKYIFMMDAQYLRWCVSEATRRRLFEVKQELH